MISKTALLALLSFKKNILKYFSKKISFSSNLISLEKIRFVIITPKGCQNLFTKRFKVSCKPKKILMLTKKSSILAISKLTSNFPQLSPGFPLTLSEPCAQVSSLTKNYKKLNKITPKTLIKSISLPSLKTRFSKLPNFAITWKKIKMSLRPKFNKNKIKKDKK